MLTSLDIRNALYLRELSCFGNNIPGLDISNNGRLKSAYTNTGLLPTTVTEDDGKTTYSCYAGSDSSGTSYYNRLIIDSDMPVYTEVTERPTITKKPSNQTVAEGKKATFTVEATGMTQYQWYYRTSSTEEWKTVSAESGKTATYSLTAKARHDGYQYRCKVTNAKGSVYTPARTLTVITEKPAITTQPTSKSVTAGKTATFKVVASGKGLSYQWYYRTSSTGTWTACSASSGKTASYSLTAQARHNGYQYRCKITNAMGSVYTKIVTLTVD